MLFHIDIVCKAFSIVSPSDVFYTFDTGRQKDKYADEETKYYFN